MNCMGPYKNKSKQIQEEVFNNNRCITFSITVGYTPIVHTKHQGAVCSCITWYHIRSQTSINHCNEAIYCQLGMLGREEFNENIFMATNIVLFKKSNIILKFSAPITKCTQTSKYYFLYLSFKTESIIWAAK